MSQGGVTNREVIQETLWLALETSGQACAVALSQCESDRATGGVTLLAGRYGFSEQPSTVILWPWIQEVMAQAGRELTDLGAVVVSRGPGSMTSIRVGLAAAQGLAFALSCPLLGLSTFDLLWGCVPESASEQTVHVIVDTRGSQLCLQTYEGEERRLMTGTRDVLAAHVLANPGWLIGQGENPLENPLGEVGSYIDVGDRNLAFELATQVWSRRQDPEIQDTAPIYGLAPAVQGQS